VPRLEVTEDSQTRTQYATQVTLVSTAATARLPPQFDMTASLPGCIRLHVCLLVYLHDHLGAHRAEARWGNVNRKLHKMPDASSAVREGSRRVLFVSVAIQVSVGPLLSTSARSPSESSRSGKAIVVEIRTGNHRMVSRVHGDHAPDASRSLPARPEWSRCMWPISTPRTRRRRQTRSAADYPEWAPELTRDPQPALQWAPERFDARPLSAIVH
jgi:hypothetical protein